MHTKKEWTGEASGLWSGLLILVVGIVIGVLARPGHWFGQRAPDRGLESAAVPRLHPFLEQPTGQPATAPSNGLETIEILLPPGSAETLQRVRDRAMTRGVIVQEDTDTVPAHVVLGNKKVKADVRIKGDWLDHVSSDKWSLRIELKSDKLFGMSVFSIQSPKTRGMLWEWLVLATARREGVLAPRADFVNVVLNGHPAGVYYLEEHFSKEMLESQKRREGPIVLWDESTHWATLLRMHLVDGLHIRGLVPAPLSLGYGVSGAQVRAFGEKRLGEIDSLSRALFSAVEKMRDLRALLTPKTDLRDRVRLLRELSALENDAIGDIVNTDLLARSHAIASLMQVEHSLAWHNMRFYLDPVLDRLEPIMFDNMAHLASDPLPVPLRARDLTAEFANNHDYYEGVFRYLGEYCHPQWLDDLFTELAPDLERFEAALVAEGSLRPGFLAAMKQRLRTEQGFLRQLIYPIDPINVEAFYEIDDSADAVLSGDLEVLAWATSRVPTVVEGLRFSNGGFLPAASHVDGDTLTGEHAAPGPAAPAWRGSRGASLEKGSGVVLPTDSSPLRFRFPIDERLANLESAREIKQAFKERASGPQAPTFEASLVYRPIAATEPQEEVLRFRRYDPAWIAEGGRPKPPDCETALQLHPFLRYGPETGDLVVDAGTWEVNGDLVIPSGHALRIEPGATLRFQPEAILVADSALLFEGSRDEPIVLEPVAGADRWRGIAVLGAPERSRWSHVVVRGTDAVRRGGWMTTGGITFYRSSLSMTDCLVEGSMAEDGCNVFAADVDLARVTFEGCASDSFDGDFVTGKFTECTFRNGLADGLDFSGSDVDVVDCRFLDMGDKAISVGEDTRVRVRGGIADGVSIGIASKDRSDASIQGMAIRNARHYALAAFIKKAEFGPSVLHASGVELTGSGLADALAQTGCELTIDEVPVATQDLDVAALYRDKILGQ